MTDQRSETVTPGSSGFRGPGPGSGSESGSAPGSGRGAAARWASAAQFAASLALTIGFLLYLLFWWEDGDHGEAVEVPRPEPVAEVVGPNLIRVRSGGPLDAKMRIFEATPREISDPLMTVAGQVTASLRPGQAGSGEDFWQFDSPETLSTYNDWQKARIDIVFSETQLRQARELADARVKAQTEIVARLERLVTAGTDAPRDLELERANLIQARIAGAQEVYQAETALRVARREEAALGRLLQQSGLEPELLTTATSDIDIVIADVPEGRLNRVRVGQGCRASFFGFPNEVFTGVVRSVAPVLSSERRSLRVLFVIDDPDDKLRPGMFAEIGLGTDPRETLLIPADAVLHIDRSDYVLVSAGPDLWRVTEIQAGESRDGEVEALRGLSPGDRAVAAGAILFKPLVIRALRTVEPPEPKPEPGSESEPKPESAPAPAPAAEGGEGR